MSVLGLPSFWESISNIFGFSFHSVASLNFLDMMPASTSFFPETCAAKSHKLFGFAHLQI